MSNVAVPVVTVTWKLKMVAPLLPSAAVTSVMEIVGAAAPHEAVWVPSPETVF
jgi:hypothetical protein